MLRGGGKGKLNGRNLVRLGERRGWDILNEVSRYMCFKDFRIEREAECCNSFSLVYCLVLISRAHLFQNFTQSVEHLLFKKLSEAIIHRIPAQVHVPVHLYDPPIQTDFAR